VCHLAGFRRGLKKEHSTAVALPQPFECMHVSESWGSPKDTIYEKGSGTGNPREWMGDNGVAEEGTQTRCLKKKKSCLHINESASAPSPRYES